jgi:hypothetical protein
MRLKAWPIATAVAGSVRAADRQSGAGIRTGSVRKRAAARALLPRCRGRFGAIACVSDRAGAEL